MFLSLSLPDKNASIKEVVVMVEISSAKMSWLYCRNGQYVWEDHRPRSGVWKGTSGGEAISFSGCDDDQTSADTSVSSRFAPSLPITAVYFLEIAIVWLFFFIRSSLGQNSVGRSCFNAVPCLLFV